jgi:hypothetical protein
MASLSPTRSATEIHIQTFVENVRKKKLVHPSIVSEAVLTAIAGFIEQEMPKNIAEGRHKISHLEIAKGVPVCITYDLTSRKTYIIFEKIQVGKLVFHSKHFLSLLYDPQNPLAQAVVLPEKAERQAEKTRDFLDRMTKMTENLIQEPSTIQGL